MAPLTQLARLKMTRALAFVVVIVVIAGVPATSSVEAQELEPRSYTPAPIGTTIVLASAGGSKGDILFDPSLDLDDVKADLTIVTTGLGYTFNLAGRQARVVAVLPVAWGAVSAEVHQIPVRQNVGGLIDPRIKLSIGLRGAPALTLADFVRTPKRTALGASVTVVPPLGQYSADRLVNLGYHRWAFKPEIGLSRAAGPWTIDGYLGLWLFMANGAYFPGHSRRTQDPIVSGQVHVSRALPRRFWVAFDATGFAGGQSFVDGVPSPDRQLNRRLGGTLSMPIARQQSIKLAYSTGVTTLRGSDFDTLTVTWQLVVF